MCLSTFKRKFNSSFKGQNKPSFFFDRHNGDPHYPLCTGLWIFEAISTCFGYLCLVCHDEWRGGFWLGVRAYTVFRRVGVYPPTPGALPPRTLKSVQKAITSRTRVRRFESRSQHKHRKVQTTAYFFWHGHAVCTFSGKSLLSSHKTTL